MDKKPEFGPNGAVVNNPEMSEELRKEYLSQHLWGRVNFWALAKGGLFAILLDLPFVTCFAIVSYRVQVAGGGNISPSFLIILFGWIFFKVLLEKFGHQVTSKWAVTKIVSTAILLGLCFSAYGASYLGAQKIIHWSLIVGAVLLVGGVVGHLLWLMKRERA